MKLVIVGAVAGGATVAAQVRRALPDSEIILFGCDPVLGYGTCGMPYVIGGVIDEKSKIAGPSPSKFAHQRNIEVRLEHEVLAVDRTNKTVKVQNLLTGEHALETYDKLILSPGGRARIPKLKGLGNLPLFTLKNFGQMEEVLAYIDREKPRACAVIGGGFIGIEVAENLIHQNLKTVLINRDERVMSVMDPEISEVLGNEMKDNGVEIYFNDAIDRIEGRTLFMDRGPNFSVDFLVACIGIDLNTELAAEAGLSIGPTGGMVVNDYMQTDDPDIYAIGDAVESKDWFTGKPKNVKLAWHAHRQAAIVASHLAGNPVRMNGLLGTTITKLFSLTAAITGHSAKSLTDEGIAFDTAIYDGRTNAGYYPDHGQIHLRVHYDRATRRILGAQAVGDKGVDKRIDVIATAILGKMTVDDLAALELCYSPPYSSPKDPINMIGYKAK